MMSLASSEISVRCAEKLAIRRVSYGRDENKESYPIIAGSAQMLYFIYKSVFRYERFRNRIEVLVGCR
jgi:hypothetical protein